MLAAWSTAATQRTNAWLQLRTDDDQKDVLLAAVAVAALSATGDDVNGSDFALALDGSFDRRQRQPALIRNLARCGALTIVIDDVNVLTADGALSALDRLLDDLPAGLRLVLASQSEPDLALSTRRLRGQAVGFDFDDLALTASEIEQIAALHGR